MDMSEKHAFGSLSKRQLQQLHQGESVFITPSELDIELNIEVVSSAHWETDDVAHVEIREFDLKQLSRGEEAIITDLETDEFSTLKLQPP